MKNLWKRTLSLVLSGVLLLGSVPMDVFAEEETTAPVETTVVETQPIETEPAQIQPEETKPTVTETQPATEPAVQVITDDVAADGLENETEPAIKVLVDNKDVTEEGQFDRNIVSYDATQKELTLRDATVTSVESNDDLTVILPKDTESEISGSISAKNLTIKGDGTLTVGQIITSENLIVSSNVAVGQEKQQPNESPVPVIEVKNKIELTDTETTSAHLIVKQTIVFTENSDTEIDSQEVQNWGVTGAGYYRTSAAGNEYTRLEQDAWYDTASGEYFEFVSDGHVNYQITASHHKLTCNEKCAMNPVTIFEDEHSQTKEGDLEATCKAEAYCSVCKERYGKKKPHTTEPKWVPTEDGKRHIKKYENCGCTDGEAMDHETNSAPVLSQSKEALVRVCADCKATVPLFTIMQPVGDAEDRIVWDGQKKEARIEPQSAGTITYYKDNVPEDETGGFTEAPVEPGKYIAVLTIVNQTLKPRIEFTIEKKSAETLNISKIDDREYTGSVVAPSTVEVKDGEASVNSNRYTLSYERKATDSDEFVETNDLTNAGIIRVTATMKSEDTQYTGSVSTIFRITKADVPDDAYIVELPEQNPVYDGQEQTLICKLKENQNSVKGFGRATAEFYQTINGTETQVSAINAGTYTVKIRVAESDNYKEKELPGTQTFVIKQADVGASDALGKLYTDNTKLKQTIIKNGSFEAASFGGVYVQKGADASDDLNPEITYYYGDSQSTKQINTLKDYLAEQENDKDIPVKYSMKPGNPNYTGETKLQTIMVRKVDITFKLDGEEGFGSADLLSDNLPNGNEITFGQTGFISLEGLSAHVGGKRDDYDAQKGNFFVKYTGVGVQDEKDAPEVKYNKFTVYYSGELNGTKFEKVPVRDPQYLTVRKKTPTVTVKPAAELVYQANGQNQTLEVATTDGGTLKYRIHGQTDWKETLPLKDAAVYWVYYKVEGGDNYRDLPESLTERKITVKILPKLEATYKDKLSTVTLPNGWSWNTDAGDPLMTEVGNAGEYAEYTYTLDYNVGRDSAQNPTATAQKISFKVNPIKVRVDVTLKDKYLPFNKGVKLDTGKNAEVIEAAVAVRVQGATADLPTTEYTTECTNITNTADEKVRNPGYAQIKVISAGNYEFENPEAELTKQYVVFRPGSTTLGDSTDAVPPEMTEYETGKEIKEALDKKYTDSFIKSKRTYKKYMMLDKSMNPLYEEFYWPDDSLVNKWTYEKGLTQEDTFKIWGVYTVTSSRLGTTAGEFFEMEEIDSGTPGPNEFRLDEKEIQFNLKNYAILCFAAEIDTTKEYDIAKSIVLDGKSSTKGSLAFKIGTSTVTKATYGQTVEVTAKANSGYSIEKVTFTAESGESVNAEKVAEGSYKFTMPASKVTVKLSLKKTTSSAKNPNSGDTSNIQLWVTVLAASGAAIGVLMAFWLKKRKK